MVREIHEALLRFWNTIAFDNLPAREAAGDHEVPGAPGWHSSEGQLLLERINVLPEPEGRSCLATGRHRIVLPANIGGTLSAPRLTIDAGAVVALRSGNLSTSIFIHAGFNLTTTILFLASGSKLS